MYVADTMVMYSKLYLLYSTLYLLYIIVHISTTTGMIVISCFFSCSITQVLSCVDKLIPMTILINGSEGSLEFGDVEWFRKVGEKSSFLAPFLRCLSS